MESNNRIIKEIEEEFIEILEYGKNLTGEEVWTDLEKIQWLREKIDELLKSQREEIIKKIKEKGLHLGYKNDIINLISSPTRATMGNEEE